MADKLAKDVPDPPTLTEEDLQRIVREGREWAEEFRRKIRAIEDLTAEDWSTRVR